DHAERLIKRTNQVLSQRVVDADLAADGAVHLREQRRRHVDQSDAAQVGRGGEARHVADDAPAQGDERGRAIGIGADERLVNPCDGRQLLVALAVGDQDRLGRVQRAGELRTVQAPDQRAGHDEAACRGLEIVEHAADAIERAVADRHGVRARGYGDVDADRIHQMRMVGYTGVHSTDDPGVIEFVIVGGGVAGLRAAIGLAPAGRVLVLTKAEPAESNTGYAQGGVAAAIGDDDSPALHAADTIRAGDGLCDEAAVGVLVEQGPQYVRELIDWGARFDLA